MALLRLMLQSGARNRWRSWLALTLLTAVVVGLVLAGAATARRTATAFPRFEAAHGYDAFFYSVGPVPRVASLPEVASVTRLRAPAVGAPTCACGPINGIDFSIDEVPSAQLTQVVKLVGGRLPDQSDPDQVLASYNLEALGVHIGSVLHVPLAASSQRAQVLSSANITPTGPTVTLHVVGFSVSEFEFPTTSNPPSYDVYATSSFARKYDGGAVVFNEYMFRLRHGAASLPRFETQVRALGGLSGTDLDALANSIATSIDPQAVGWWILTGLAALVGIIVLAQALARQAALEADDYPVLGALGATRRQLFTLTMARTLAVALAGAVGGMLLATLLSYFVPVGEARLADPTPGFDFDALLLIGSAAVAVVVVLVLGVWPAVRASQLVSRRDDDPVVRSSRVVALLTASGAPPSALIGIRNALERGRGRTAVPVSSALVGAVLAVAVLCGTAVFGASLTHLTSTPAQYGQAFDASFSANSTGSVAQNLQLLDDLERPGIAAITAGVSSDVSINGHVVDGVAGQSLRGPYLITIVDGRLPAADDEVVLGAKTMSEVGARVGSTVRVSLAGSSSPGGTKVRSYRVVGTTVLPPDFTGASLGTGAVFTLDGLMGPVCPSGARNRACISALVVDQSGAYLVRTTPGRQGTAALAALSRDYSSQVSFPHPPTDLVNFGEAVNFPLIFGLVVVLFGLATLLHMLLSSLNRRRREMGLLKSLGFVRRQIALSVSWQTTTVAAIGILLGVPLGIAAGRLVWDAFASNLGVVAVPVVTAWVVAAIVVGTLVVANLLAVGPALVASRTRAASLLKSE
ncbi:MAG TPA: FtsX-like permease family protein [Acidimicrobiales bacterium]|nr:FtsX-like permease family protein [Acidimicrobiales bacterium]